MDERMRKNRINLKYKLVNNLMAGFSLRRLVNLIQMFALKTY